ncbi:MAG: lipopolysaccharide heptosyltransferase II [Candidatus Gastranaerophilales bacterium]|nr:lipopolysaccharide heptosyltransferase II [Candidatus Gastranaerophilales bacterium]
MPKNKILVVRYRFIGDTILTLPFLKNLRFANPDAQIDMLVAPKSGEIIENCPYVDNFIYFDTTKKHKYENGAGEKKSFWYYVKKLRAEKYDKAYVLKRSLSSAVLVFLGGIKERIGFDTEGRGFLLTKRVPYDHDKHESQCFLDVLRSEGVEIKDESFENGLNPAAEEKIDKILSEQTDPNLKKVIVHATATNKGKLWPLENFAQVTEYLINEKNVQVLFIGTDFDSQTYDKMLEMIKNPLKVQPINFCGQFNLQESLALTAKVDLLIGNDSGNLHMASSVHTDVIGLYGPMPFKKWYALGENNTLLKADLPCMPCGLRKKCPNGHECMKKITVDEVKKAIDKHL